MRKIDFTRYNDILVIENFFFFQWLDRQNFELGSLIFASYLLTYLASLTGLLDFFWLYRGDWLESLIASIFFPILIFPFLLGFWLIYLIRYILNKSVLLFKYRTRSRIEVDLDYFLAHSSAQFELYDQEENNAFLYKYRSLVGRSDGISDFRELFYERKRELELKMDLQRKQIEEEERERAAHRQGVGKDRRGAILLEQREDEKKRAEQRQKTGREERDALIKQREEEKKRKELSSSR